MLLLNQIRSFRSSKLQSSLQIKNTSIQVNILPFGAAIQSIHLSGYEHSLVLGAKNENALKLCAPYLGTVVGRVANRINLGRFLQDDKFIQLAVNERGKHHLHGGDMGASHQLWSVEHSSDEEIRLVLVLKDGEMGYPGNMEISLTYSLEESALLMRIEAVADSDSPCSFAQHSFFNLDGQGSILDHSLSIDAHRFTSVNEELIPDGFTPLVEGTEFDFRSPRAIGEKISAKGLDINYCLSNHQQSIRKVATLRGPKSGISLSLATTEPGLQLYDGAGLDVPAHYANSGQALGAFSGVALEPQFWPDAVNHSHFPTPFLKAGERYIQETKFSFS